MGPSSFRLSDTYAPSTLDENQDNIQETIRAQHSPSFPSLASGLAEASFPSRFLVFRGLRPPLFVKVATCQDKERGYEKFLLCSRIYVSYYRIQVYLIVFPFSYKMLTAYSTPK